MMNWGTNRCDLCLKSHSVVEDLCNLKDSEILLIDPDFLHVYMSN